jgi:hypothetical protein
MMAYSLHKLLNCQSENHSLQASNSQVHQSTLYGEWNCVDVRTQVSLETLPSPLDASDECIQRIHLDHCDLLEAAHESARMRWLLPFSGETDRAQRLRTQDNSLQNSQWCAFWVVHQFFPLWLNLRGLE